MCKGGNPDTLNLKIKQICGIILQFCFDLVDFKGKIISLDFFQENSYFPC